MKIVRRIHYFMLLATLILNCCSTYSQSANSNAVPKDGMPIIEVVTNANDSVYPPGQTLELRIYDSGLVEFDFFPLQAEQLGKPYKAELKKSKISDEDLQQLIKLLKEVEVENVKNRYEPTQ